MKNCDCNERRPGFIRAPRRGGCIPKPCDYIKTYFLPANLGTDEEGQPYAPKPGAEHDAFVVYQANGAIWFYDHQGAPLHITGGGVTSVNGETGDIVLGTLTIRMNGEQLAQYNAGQSVEVDLPIPELGEIATGNTGYITGDMAHELKAQLLLALANETGAREEADEALSTGLQTEATARKDEDAKLASQITKLQQGTADDINNLQTNINALYEKESTDVNNLQLNINNLATKHTQDITGLRTEIDDIEQQQSTDKTELEAQIQSNTDLIAQQETRVSSNTTAIQENTKNIEANDADIAAAQKDISDNKTAITALQQSSSDTSATLNQNVQRDTTVTTNPSTVTLTKSLGNVGEKTSTDTEIALPVASETQAGVMSASIYQSLQEVASKVDALNEGAVEIADLPTSPTQAELTTAWKTATGKEDLFTNAKILDSTNNKVWTYYENTSNWVPTPTDVTVEPVNIATNTSLGVTKGDTADGKIAIEADGSMSVNGYDKLVAKDNSLESSIGTLTSQQEATATGLTELEGKVTTNTSNITSLQEAVNSLEGGSGQKLYADYGENTDGAITQKAITYKLQGETLSLGSSSTATGQMGVALGASSSGTKIGSTAVGAEASATGNGSTAIGATSKATALAATAIGGLGAGSTKGAKAQADYSVAIGAGATTTTGVGGIAIGTTSETQGGIAVGHGSTVNAENGLAIGYNTRATRDTLTGIGSIALGYESLAKEPGTLSLGHDAGDPLPYGRADVTTSRRITHVTAGQADTDAANVAQVNAVDTKVATNTNNISNLAATVEGHTTSIATLNTNVEAINTAIGEANARLNTLVDGTGV